MSFLRTLLLGIAGWVAMISLAHAWLNWGIFDPKPTAREERTKFKVGFLPVT